MHSCTILTGKHQDIVVVDIFLAVGQFQEFIIDLIQLFLRQFDTQHLQTVFQCSPSATGSQHDCIIVDTHLFRVDNLITLTILQNTVLVDTRRMSKRVTSDDRLVWLDRHIHQA